MQDHPVYAESLYRLFGVPSTCTDDELRRAYHRTLREHHPDRNPNEVESATVKTQKLTSAYAELKYRRRTSQLAETQVVDNEHGFKITVGMFVFTIQTSFGSVVDTKDIAGRKTAFRNEWENFRQNPSDAMRALRLLHAAFRAERHDSLTNLLLNPILIDSASLLLSLLQKEDACETLIKWAEVLQHSHNAREAIQILEDTWATGDAVPSVAK